MVIPGSRISIQTFDTRLGVASLTVTHKRASVAESKGVDGTLPTPVMVMGSGTPEPITMSSKHNVGYAAEVIEQFMLKNDLAVPRDGWENNLIYPDGECSGGTV